jgi:hypothetical protein
VVHHAHAATAGARHAPFPTSKKGRRSMNIQHQAHRVIETTRRFWMPPATPV